MQKWAKRACLYNRDTMTLVHLNESAAVIWQLCDGQRTVEQMIAVLRSAYPEQSDRLESEIRDTIREFAAQNIVSFGVRS